MTYQYDELNRLTNMSLAHLATPIAGYAYALNPSGHRTQVRELGGRTASYGYDNLYRLTQETISGTLIAGQIAYSYDAVGNRLGRNSTVTNILEKLYDYDMNDRSGSDSYDAAGNTKAAEVRGQSSDVSFTYDYDFENRLLSAQSASSAVALLYDGDGNRVAKTVTDGMGSRRTWFLVDDRNLTGYSQVLAELGTWNLELGTGAVTRAYTYGLDLISQTRYSSLIAEHSFYGYDGHGNARCLTDTNGYITDTYDYDAFGTLIEQKAWDPNAFALVPVSTDNRSLVTDNLYLYCGEQFDPDLGLYFLRARYLDTDRGRFWSMDVFEGVRDTPSTQNKYLYAGADPVDFLDYSGYAYDLTVAGQMVNIHLEALLRSMAVTAAMYTTCRLSRMLDEIPGSPGPLIPVPPCRDDDLFRVLFHYSRTSYLLGESINSGTWLTDNGALTASQANLALGLRGLPKMLYAIKVKDKEILGGLPVQWSPNAPYAGVIPAREWITTCTLPFTRIVTGGSI